MKIPEHLTPDDTELMRFQELDMPEAESEHLKLELIMASTRWQDADVTYIQGELRHCFGQLAYIDLKYSNKIETFKSFLAPFELDVDKKWLKGFKITSVLNIQGIWQKHVKRVLETGNVIYVYKGLEDGRQFTENIPDIVELALMRAAYLIDRTRNHFKLGYENHGDDE